jgi:hypothetical protein
MNPLQKAVLLYLGTKNYTAVSILELHIMIKLLAKTEAFKDLRDYLNKLEEPILP